MNVHKATTGGEPGHFKHQMPNLKVDAEISKKFRSQGQVIYLQK